MRATIILLLLYSFLHMVSNEWFDSVAEYDDPGLPDIFDRTDQELEICAIDDCQSNVSCGRHLKRGCVRFFVSQCQLFYVACKLKRPWILVDFTLCIINQNHCNDPCSPDEVREIEYTDYV